ncbi:MAG: DUF4382 domain-containing protein [Gammaproteobacteria bacterium]|nr:DUF4382 domain-containing protein [Gammaproteobacteria bacterium]MDE2024126.1 DUF4382 domain-containing protein [Gammaproteobacteria bacterium]MDE2139035.1 DUF4382 domain-containing protein [Gammaproteobacteria bacterium]MDE2273217.1 DUF4382 domain-containing protein [Gammaproteobacteria bacterium]
MLRYVPILLLLSFLSLVAGCNSSSDNGLLSLSLTDAPVDGATNVVVDITAIQAIPQNGSPITYTLPQPQQIDLLQLQQGVSTPLVNDWSLPPGQYIGLNVFVSADPSVTDSYIVLNDGNQYPLVPLQPVNPTSCGLPCANTAELSVNTPFTVSSNENGAYVIDFDARKSVLPPATPGGTQYLLQPEGRMAAILDSGNLIGIVPNSLITPGCTPAVYIFAGANATPTDIDNYAPPVTQPVTEQAVILNNNTGDYVFTGAFLPAGTYTLAFTCEAALDNPGTADNITFTFTGSVPVAAQTTFRVVLTSPNT